LIFLTRRNSAAQGTSKNKIRYPRRVRRRSSFLRLRDISSRYRRYFGE
jgi:hypothetical protein